MTLDKPHPIPTVLGTQVAYLEPGREADALFAKRVKTWQYVVLERGPKAYVTTGFSDAAMLQAYLRSRIFRPNNYVFLGILHVDKTWLPTGTHGRQELADLLEEKT